MKSCNDSRQVFATLSIMRYSSLSVRVGQEHSLSVGKACHNWEEKMKRVLILNLISNLTLLSLTCGYRMSVGNVTREK